MINKGGGDRNFDIQRRDVERGQDDDSEDGQLFEKSERKVFVAKVYSILSIQLGFTFAIIFGVTYNEEVREYMDNYFWVAYIFMVAQLILYCVLICSESVRRSYPINFILLTIHTAFFAVMAAFISAKYETFVIWLAFLATAIITITVSVFAKFTPWDVTGCSMFFCIAFLALSIFSLLAMIVHIIVPAPILFTIISGIAVVLLSFYLMFMTQLILGGRKGQIGTDEVVFAVIILYVTIMQLFLELLRLINACAFSED